MKYITAAAAVFSGDHSNCKGRGGGREESDG